MSNVFEPKKNAIPLQPKTAPNPGPARTAFPAGGLKLPTTKPKRKQCSLYLDIEMMERVKQIAQRSGWTISELMESFVKAGLEQMEG